MGPWLHTFLGAFLSSSLASLGVNCKSLKNEFLMVAFHVKESGKNIIYVTLVYLNVACATDHPLLSCYRCSMAQHRQEPLLLHPLLLT